MTKVMYSYPLVQFLFKTMKTYEYPLEQLNNVNNIYYSHQALLSHSDF